MRRGSVWLIEGIPATPTQNMKDSHWLDLRKCGIGGSDIAAIMGHSPWNTPLGIYCQKVGLAPNPDPTEAMEFGTRMEPTLRAWAEDELKAKGIGFDCRVLSSPYLYRDPAKPFIANVDGVVLRTDNGAEQAWSGLELKTVDRYFAKEWDGELPLHYREQVQWYMGITGLPRWVVAALLGKRFEVRVVERDQQLIDEETAAAERFWTEYVLPRRMPDATAKDGNLLVEIFPGSSETVLLDDGYEETLRRYLEVQNQEKEIVAQKDELRAKIEQRIGDSKGLKAGSITATWNRYDIERVDPKALKANHPEVYEQVKKTSREGRLSVKKAKEEV